PVTPDPGPPPGTLAQPGHPPQAPLRPLRLGGPHHAPGKRRGVDLRGRLGRAQGLIDPHPIPQPTDAAASAALASPVWSAGDAAIGLEAAVAPIALDPLREFGVQGKAPPRERLERSSIAPVLGQKPARLAGGRASDARPFDDRRPDAAAAQ